MIKMNWKLKDNLKREDQLLKNQKLFFLLVLVVHEKTGLNLIQSNIV